MHDSVDSVVLRGIRSHHETHHYHRSARTPARGQGGAVPGRRHRDNAQSRERSRGRAGDRESVPRQHGRHGIPREGQDRDGVLGAVRRAVHQSHLGVRPHRRSGRWQDLRPGHRTRDPDPHWGERQRRAYRRERGRRPTRGTRECAPRGRRGRRGGVVNAISAGDTAWVLTSTALVMVMTVGLAFFYGGLVRPKNALNTMMMSVVALGLISVQWVLFGYSIAFGHGSPLWGGLAWVGFSGVGVDFEPPCAATIPLQAHAMFQLMFAIITPALISGAIVERMRFRAFVVFLLLWATFVYDPLAHWVWGSGGWLAKLGALDFAGGTVVHISAGVSALVAARMLGPRKDFKRVPIVPHNVPLVLLGAGLLWFGWFGFNAGSALAANGLAAIAFTNTNTAAATALVTWAALDVLRTGKATAVGAATGLVVGLVGITPAAGYISAPASLAIGALAALVSYTAIQIRATTRLDDSLDVFSCHGLAGVAGAMLTGVFATKLANPAGGDGWLAGNFGQMGVQLLAVLATVVLAATGTALIMALVKVTIGTKADVRSQLGGLDLSEHGEEAYFGEQGVIAGAGAAVGQSVIVATTLVPEPIN